MKTPKTVTAVNGKTLEVDISEEACARFGFKPGQRIHEPLYGMDGTVVGTAPMPLSSPCQNQGDEMLWLEMDNMEGRVCFFPNPEINLTKL